MEGFCNHAGSHPTFTAFVKPSWLRDAREANALNLDYFLWNYGLMVPLGAGGIVLIAYVLTVTCTLFRFNRRSVCCRWRKSRSVSKVSGLMWGAAGTMITITSGLGLIFAAQTATRLKDFQCGTLSTLQGLEESRTNWRGLRNVVSDLEYLVAHIPAVKAEVAKHLEDSAILDTQFASHLNAMDASRTVLEENQQWPPGAFGHQCVFCGEVLHNLERYDRTLRTGYLGKLLNIRAQLNVNLVLADPVTPLRKTLDTAKETLEFVLDVKNDFAGMDLLSSATRNNIELYFIVVLITVNWAFAVLVLSIAFMFWLGTNRNIEDALHGVDERADGDLEQMSGVPHQLDGSRRASVETTLHWYVVVIVRLIWWCQGMTAALLFSLGCMSISSAFVAQDKCALAEGMFFGDYLRECRVNPAVVVDDTGNINSTGRKAGDLSFVLGVGGAGWANLSWANLGSVEKEIRVDYFDDLVRQSTPIGNRLAGREFVYTTDVLQGAARRSSCSLTRQRSDTAVDMPRYLDILNALSTQYRYVFASTPEECPLKDCDVITNMRPSNSTVQQRKLVADFASLHAQFALTFERTEGLISTEARGAMRSILDRKEELSRLNCTRLNKEFDDLVYGPMCNERTGFVGLLLSSGTLLCLGGLFYGWIARTTYMMWRRAIFRPDESRPACRRTKVVPAQ
eukprot:GEMP01028174.1.p1 GENE.GEMP01028174.1~~GEMP01028174.1.p1  ORF type:complete len:681 (+),score=142.16 GEMP01028174.1:136-2178(+)